MLWSDPIFGVMPDVLHQVTTVSVLETVVKTAVSGLETTVSSEVSDLETSVCKTGSTRHSFPSA